MRYGGRNAINNKKVVGRIRKSQLITTFGTGSIVDLPDYSVIMASTNYWNGGNKIYEPNLQRLLGMAYFKEPKYSEGDAVTGMPDIPAFRFPNIHFCPKCNKLMSYKIFGDSDGRKCPECNKELVPSRFVAACINGHIEDFPYYWWVHSGDKCEKEVERRYDKLKIDFSSSSGGLGSIKILCTSCNKIRSMEGSMSNDALRGYKCFGHRPWLGKKSEYNDPDICNGTMKTLQRGASNVYFGITQSAITIPPFSKPIQKSIEEKWDTIVNFTDNKPQEAIMRVFVKSLFIEEINKGLYNEIDYINEINRRLDNKDYEEEYTETKLFEDEYRALSIQYEGDSEDRFKAIESPVPTILEDYIKSVMLIKRVREVLVLKGFRRITPEMPNMDDERYSGTNGNEFVSLSEASQQWLPAIEMLGEGIFIRFDEHKVQHWEKKIEKRYTEMRKRLAEDNIDKHKFSARYVLLHTFSHLLIRQLTTECGYSGSALKERIYSTYPDSTFEMGGIFIYTSSSDSDGSLGGLVRQGDTLNFQNIIFNLLQEATWCSSDPLCIESKQQGYNSLNYAACHACTLLPETSCEARNCLLDRVAVIGDLENTNIGYFSELLEV